MKYLAIGFWSKPDDNCEPYSLSIEWESTKPYADDDDAQVVADLLKAEGGTGLDTILLVESVWEQWNEHAKIVSLPPEVTHHWMRWNGHYK